MPSLIVGKSRELVRRTSLELRYMRRMQRFCCHGRGDWQDDLTVMQEPIPQRSESWIAATGYTVSTHHFTAINIMMIAILTFRRQSSRVRFSSRFLRIDLPASKLSLATALVPIRAGRCTITVTTGSLPAFVASGFWIDFALSEFCSF